MPSPLTRRRFLRLLGQGALAAAVPGPLLAETTGTVTISLLHTTDLHGHILPTTDYHARPNLGGLARCATQIRTWRATNPNSLLLDVGDVYQGTAVSLASRGALMIRCFAALGYDAWVVGNHEFDWGADAFAAAVAASPLPVLAQMVADPNARRVLHPIGTRDAVIDFFTARGKVGAGDLLVENSSANLPAVPYRKLPESASSGQGRDD